MFQKHMNYTALKDIYFNSVDPALFVALRRGVDFSIVQIEGLAGPVWNNTPCSEAFDRALMVEIEVNLRKGRLAATMMEYTQDQNEFYVYGEFLGSVGSVMECMKRWFESRGFHTLLNVDGDEPVEHGFYEVGKWLKEVLENTDVDVTIGIFGMGFNITIGENEVTDWRVAR